MLIEKLMTVSIIWLGALMVFDGRITIGQLVAFQMLAGRVTGPLLQLVSLIHAYQEAALSAQRIGHIMDTEPERRSAGLQPKLEGGIAFDQVSFQYPNGSRPALNDITFSVAPGTVLGVVGRSGSGKSTLVLCQVCGDGLSVSWSVVMPSKEASHAQEVPGDAHG